MRRFAAVAAAVALSLPVARPAVAACAETVEAVVFERAPVVLEGVAQDGPTHDGVLLSPARFTVQRYIKGSGARDVLVSSAVRQVRDGVFEVSAEGITPAPGDVWRIYGTPGADGILVTDICAGSRRTGWSQATLAAGGASGDTGPAAERSAVAAVLVGSLALGAAAVVARWSRRAR